MLQDQLCNITWDTGIKMKKIVLFIVVFMANVGLCDERPRPNVITGGNPRKKDVPWPTEKASDTKRLYTHLYGTLGDSTYYQRAYRKVYYKGYIRYYNSCAAHRSGVYEYRRSTY